MSATLKSYPSDLTDAEWELLCELIPESKPGGRRRSVEMRAVINAILYVLCAGCAWRMLPHDYPKWKTVYHYFRLWRIDGTWERIHHQLRLWLRVVSNREASPSQIIIDSQSVESGNMVHLEVGYDAAKQIKGRKRHFAVDTLGLLLVVVVGAASDTEYHGARCLLSKLNQLGEMVARLVSICVDAGYQGEQFMRWVMDTYRWILTVVKRPAFTQGFVLLPKRWIVERTFGWLNWCRRLSKDYELLPQTSESFIYIAMIRLMVKRLA